jgi:NADPH-dependent ferric siderophore reductase
MARVRREPPRFRTAEVRAVEDLTPRMRRVTFGGDDLEGLVIDQPAASVRLLLPGAGETELVMPTWNGNEFRLPDGARPTIRTFTPWHLRPDRRELDLGVVLHGTGAASEWARDARPGDPVAIAGPGRGYAIDADASSFLLAGDETALPAISQLLEALPKHARVSVLIEIATPEGRLELPAHPAISTQWVEQRDGAPPGDALIAAIENAEISADARIWAAGEAAAVQRIRRHLFETREIPRVQTTVRGYWKHGRAADAGDVD